MTRQSVNAIYTMNATNKNNFHTENQQKRVRYALVFAFLLIALFMMTLINIKSGNVDISMSKIVKVIFSGSGNTKDINIIWRIRLPRIIMSAILGGGLSLSGFLLQTFFRNPIAGPFVLGISSGARMVVAFVMIFSFRYIEYINSYTMISAAFVGSMLSVAFILLVARKIRNMASLLVAGIMIGYICSAVTDFIITFASDSDIANLHGWAKGSFSGMSWSNVEVGSIVIFATLFISMVLSKPIGAYRLGEAYARSMGVNIKIFRITLIVISSLFSATVTAFAGPISFVGIAVPFLVKALLGTSSPIVVIPATFLGGAVFCMFCDLIARLALAPLELNISTVTSVLGAPIVIYMMINRKRGENG